jgi:hypothetical protein
VAGLIRRQPYSTQSKPPRPASAAAAAQPAPRPPAAASPRPTSAPPLPAPRAARPGRGSYVSAFPPASASESDLLAAAHAAARVDWERSDFAQAAQRLARDADADDPPELAAARAAAGSTPASLGASAALALSSGRGSPRPMAARPFAFDSEAHIHLEPTLHDARARQTPCQPAPTRTRPQPGPAAARAQPPLPAQGSRARVESAGSGGGVAFAFGSGSSVDAVAAGLARVTPPHPSPADSTRVLRELAQLQDDVAIARVGLWSKSPAPYPPAAAGSSAASRRAEPWRPTTNVRRAATDRPLAESGSELPDYARLAQANRARFRPRSARAAAPKAARRGAEARPDDSLGSGEMAVKLAQLERRIAEVCRTRARERAFRRLRRVRLARAAAPSRALPLVHRACTQSVTLICIHRALATSKHRTASGQRPIARPIAPSRPASRGQLTLAPSHAGTSLRRSPHATKSSNLNPRRRQRAVQQLANQSRRRQPCLATWQGVHVGIVDVEFGSDH